MHKKFLFFALSLTFFLILFSLSSVSATTNVTNCTNLTIEQEIYTLNQSINITGDNCIWIKNDSIILDCQGYNITVKGSDVESWYAVGIQHYNNITIKNCTFLQNFTGPTGETGQDAIVFSNSTNSTIFNNTFGGVGFEGSGILFNHSINANISGNTMNYTSNSSPISLFSGSNSSVVENNNITTISMGIIVKESHNINISSNNITNSKTGLVNQTMIRLECSDNSIIDHNIVTTSGEKASGINMDDSLDVIIDLNTIITLGDNAIGIFLNNATSDLNITSNNITTSGDYATGIYLDEVNNTNFTSNTVTTSGVDAGGLNLMNSNNTVATKNTIKTEDSGACTVLVVGAENNTFYDNIFNNSNETVPGFCSGTPSLANAWNTTKALGTKNIMGGPNLGGNFWTNNASTGYSDTCIDSDGDYFCDTAYNLAGPGSEDTNNIDYLPLANHTNMISTCGILNITNKYYSLNQSVTVNGTCFNITANNITLNFNSSTITGNTTGYGVYIKSIKVTIVNGIISNFSNGLYLYNSSNDIISGLIINNSAQDAIFLNHSGSENNNFTNINIINTNTSYYDINFSTGGINGTWIIDTDFANYSFAGAGGLVNFKDSTYGIIKFLETINGSGTNLSNDVNIRSNLIFIDSSSNPGLNKSANISLYSITYTDPIPQYSSDASTWVNCTTATDPACSELSFSGNIFTFNTSHFTYFRAFEVYSTLEEGNGDAGGRGGLGFPPEEEEEVEEPITYSEGETISGEALGIPYNILIDEITNESVTLTIDNQTITLMIGESIEIDLNQDGISDLRITLFGIEEGKADLRFEEILPEEEEEEKVTPLWQKYLPHMIIGISIVLVISLIILAARKKHTSYKRKH